MQIKILKPQANIVDLFQKAGYSYRGVSDGDMSFIKRVGIDEYPHYHIYVRIEGEDVTLNLHLDQKKPSYEGAPRHSGEYEGELVEKEMERIKQLISD